MTCFHLYENTNEYDMIRIYYCINTPDTLLLRHLYIYILYTYIFWGDDMRCSKAKSLSSISFVQETEVDSDSAVIGGTTMVSLDCATCAAT